MRILLTIIMFFVIIGNTHAVYFETKSNQCLMMAKTDQEILLCNNIKHQKKLHPQKKDSKKYSSADGHLYTTFIILRAAGVEESKSYDISYCSQLPDDNLWFSASLAFFYPNIKYRNNIMGIIHSLHGGNEQAVINRRNNIKALIQESLLSNVLSNCELGILVHAYADSYAHTYSKNGKLKAYDLFLGHLLHGHEPDVIAFYPDKYANYIAELFDLFKTKKSMKLPNKFLLYVRNLSKNRKASLIQMTRYATHKYNYDSRRGDDYKKKWKEKVKREDFERLIEYIKSKI